MRPVPFLLLSLLLPLSSGFVTYTIMSAFNDTIKLDSTQASILLLALMQLCLLGSTGVFPVNLDKMFSRVWHTEKSGTESPDTESPEESRGKRHVDVRALEKGDGDNLFKLPEVDSMPCVHRLFCEVETAARTSDTYADQESQNTVDRHPEEEVDVEETDPITELYIEAIRAMYGHDDPSSPDSTRATERALQTVQGLTGERCEQAYKMCPGRYTAPMVFKAVFGEIGFRAKDEL